ncbi:hypothetical protein [Melaminivora suipulveris]|uniref:hypothetical protein n=1 Tax=Melaminivora suipulveris TaxID=2109913 RepID=UPI00131A542E|nr:hypothetical protein [Melaminivora suipulveris]
MKLLIPGSAPAPSWSEESFSPLEQALRGPEAAQARAQALAQLDAIEQRLRQTSRGGLPPTQYTLLAALLDACQAARETLTMALPPPG